MKEENEMPPVIGGHGETYGYPEYEPIVLASLLGKE